MNLLDLAAQTGIVPKFVAGTEGGEYHSACPQCGGNDRFYIQPNKRMKNCVGYYRCRSCEIQGDAISFAKDILGMTYKEAVACLGATLNSTYIEKPILNFYKPTELVLPPDLWVEKANAFAQECQANLGKETAMLAWLATRGISNQDVIDYGFGWHTKSLFLKRELWGLPPKIMEGKEKPLWLPKGLVIPTRHPDGNVMRIKIRRDDHKPDDQLPKYAVVSGSMNGMSVIGDTRKVVMIAVESELDAYAVHAAVKDFAFTVAVGSNSKNPDSYVDDLVKGCSMVLICNDNDEGGIAMVTKWRKFYHQARSYPTPIGKDVGEAVEKGLNIREWILKYVTKSK